MFGDFAKQFADLLGGLGGGGGGIAFTKKWTDFRMFAIKHHGTQMYGDLPYAYHLAMVESYLRDFGYSDYNYVAAAWLHDLVEDTIVTVADISEFYGPNIAALVWACTGEGRNREERQAEIFRRIEKHPEAAPVKAADRLANIYTSWQTKNLDKMKMYVKEWPEFNKRVGTLLTDTKEGAYLLTTLEQNIECCEGVIKQLELEAKKKVDQLPSPPSS